MSVNLGLLVVVGVMAACGVYLLMERSLIRMLLGLLLVGNGVNLLIVLLTAPQGNPPIVGRTSQGATADADPLGQAMVLTAIVITMGVAAFVLALTYRLFVINRQDDDVEDDTEDVKLLKGSLKDFPDRDRSDDPETGLDTVAGDLFDLHGNPLTPEEFAAAHREVIETDLMPEDLAVLDPRLQTIRDEMPAADDDLPDAAPDPADEDRPEGER
ncbi:MAG: Na(+)/H(+) antiporter subunit C [Gordonia sp. (in: high G+C Gram-positive bacteria)]|uniref:Na(+)/H(+) antiporter subunit C n=1 Tax=Gordonia sp. (in: high G+C Gram-positive bacteria) TaxID=84139 RepID=UPI0039E6024A